MSTEAKTPGQLAYEGREKFFGFPDPTSQWLNDEPQEERDAWEFAASQTRQPLVDRIAELERRIKEEYEPAYLMHKLRTGNFENVRFTQ